MTESGIGQCLLLPQQKKALHLFLSESEKPHKISGKLSYILHIEKQLEIVYACFAIDCKI